MLYSLRGTLIHMEAGFAVIECGGVGYKCLTTLNTQRSLQSCTRRLPYIRSSMYGKTRSSCSALHHRGAFLL